MNTEDSLVLEQYGRKQGFQDVRIGKSKKFRETPIVDRKHGLGIKTKLDWLNLDNLEVHNTTDFLVEHEQYYNEGKIKIFEGSEIENLDLPGMDKIKEEFFKSFKNSWGSWKEKIEYLHELVSKTRLIYIPEDTLIEDTVFLRKVLKGNCFEQNFLYVGKNSKANIYYKVLNNKEGLGSDFLNVYVDENATLNLVNSKDLTKDYYLHSKNLKVAGKNSNMNITTADFGGKLIVNETLIRLEGEGSSANTNNIYYSTDGERYDLSCTSEHIGRNSYSLLNSKGCIRNASSLVRGLVKITKPAFDSNGYQQSDALLLDENAKITSIPDLEIQNDQVKCSHGSTVSRLEEEKIFYMRSRGVSEEEAEKKLIEGFYHPLLDNLSEESRNELHKRLMNKNE